MEAFDLEQILDKKAVESKPTKKGTTPELNDAQFHGTVEALRRNVVVIESLQSENDMLQAELTEGVEDIRAEMSKAGLITSLRIFDGKGESVLLNWKHAYTKLPISQKETLTGATGDFDKYFEVKTSVKVKESCDMDALKDIVGRLGVDVFQRFFEVERNITPKKNYTEDFYRDFPADKRDELRQLVRQYKPALKFK
jgi:hypothetical protein